MFVVYWVELNTEGERTPFHEEFESSEMNLAMRLMEEKRSDLSGRVRFVTMCSENPNSVGKPGVSEAGPEYNWTKRRHNERPKTSIDKVQEND